MIFSRFHYAHCSSIYCQLLTIAIATGKFQDLILKERLKKIHNLLYKNDVIFQISTGADGIQARLSMSTRLDGGTWPIRATPVTVRCGCSSSRRRRATGWPNGSTPTSRCFHSASTSSNLRCSVCCSRQQRRAQSASPTSDGGSITPTPVP